MEALCERNNLPQNMEDWIELNWVEESIQSISERRYKHVMQIFSFVFPI